MFKNQNLTIKFQLSHKNKYTGITFRCESSDMNNNPTVAKPQMGSRAALIPGWPQECLGCLAIMHGHCDSEYEVTCLHFLSNLDGFEFCRQQTNGGTSFSHQM